MPRSEARVSVAVLSLAISAASAAATLEVPASYPTIQAAINVAVNGDLILVAPGTYHQRISFAGKNIVVMASAFADPSQTTIDADGIDRPVTMIGNFSSAALIGFTLIDGVATSGSGHGGGIHLSGNATISNCRIIGCTGNNGGAMYVFGDATIVDCEFIGNVGLTGVGGVANYGDGLIERCTFDANEGPTTKALLLGEGDTSVVQCSFSAAGATGESTIVAQPGHHKFDRCKFAVGDTTGIRVFGRAEVTNCIFTEADVAIGTKSNLAPVELAVGNCTFVTGGSAAVQVLDLGDDSEVTITNSIIRNSGATIEVIGCCGHRGVETLVVSDSNVEGGWPGGANVIDVDPMFVNGVSGDFRLAPGSPCIDSGNSRLVAATTTLDYGMRPRIQNDVTAPNTGQGSPVVDMGAYESTRTVRYVDADATGTNDGSSWADAYTDLQSALDDAAAEPIEFILVAEGTYRPDRGTGEETESFEIPGGTEVIGGFVGTETEIGQAAHLDHPTILTGAIGGPGVSDNSLHVVTVSNTAGVAKLTGLIIQRGNADGPAFLSTGLGGGVLATDATLVLRDCWVRQNECTGAGGGLYALNSNVAVYDCRFNLNVAGQNGGAMAFFGRAALPLIVNSLVDGNTSGGEGAVSIVSGAVGLMVNATVAGNASTGGSTGGINVGGTASLQLRNGIVWGNTGGAATVEARQIGAAGTVDVGSTTIQGWTGALGGTANLGLNPLFADPNGADNVPGTNDDDYRLSAGSTAIDTANSSWLAVAFFPTDLIGADRFVDDPGSPNLGLGPVTYLDRGCLEFAPPPCQTDLDGDGDTDGADLAILLGTWGTAGPGDVDGSGLTDGGDLAVLLGSWGPC